MEGAGEPCPAGGCAEAALAKLPHPYNWTGVG